MYGWSKIAPQPVSPDAAAQLLALRLPDLASKQHLLSDWRGKVLVVNFWATWCPPCREEIPGFIRLSEKYSGQRRGIRRHQHRFCRQGQGLCRQRRASTTRC
ncbi:MAG: TlpA family protein disulfide reductase [Comamonadaceae bacterium]|nr:TlpA family protein disulfide reductase [Comamonadaceae bacterium]